MKTTRQFKIQRTQELVIDQRGNHFTHVVQSFELTRAAIEAGFLKDLPGNELSLYLYLLTHVGQDFSLTTTPTIIASLLPCTPKEIEKGLRMLEYKEYIGLQESPHQPEELTITLDKLPTSLVTELNVDAKENSVPILNQNEESILKLNQIKESLNQEQTQATPVAVTYLLKQKVFSEEDLVRAISSMLSAQELNYGFRQELDYWFKTFDKEVIKELVRRTDDAVQRNTELNTQAYMRKIANEWIAEQILTLSDLKESDKLYRETRSLIEEYGIERLNEMTRTHWRTIHNWINAHSEDDFALSTEVARFAIQQAILRSSSGKPSLTYIEDNYIKPFKESKIKNVQEAETLIKKRANSYKSSSASTKKNATKTTNTQQNKWQLGVDFTRFREN